MVTSFRGLTAAARSSIAATSRQSHSVCRSCKNRTPLRSPPSRYSSSYSLWSSTRARSIQDEVPSSTLVTTSRRQYSTEVASSSKPKFSYRIAASYSGKNSPYNPVTNSFDFNPHNRIQQHKSGKKKRPDSGQDAFFVSRIGQTGDVALGVADGVGGWQDSGVDPADFSHGICDYMAKVAYEYTAGTPSLTAQSLMQKGYEDVCDDGSVPAGGSTACVAIAQNSGTVEVANLGDSGFLQLRLNAVHDYTEAQTHAFNTPYQLSIVPAHVRKRIAAFGGTHFADFPADSSVTRHSVRHGDVLVFATDGVWDNLSAQDTLHIVSQMMIASKAWEHTEQGITIGGHLDGFTIPGDPDEADAFPSLQNILAVSIASEAKAASVNTKVDGPFAKEVQKRYPQENWKGGKVDDICVVVAVVVEEGK